MTGSFVSPETRQRIRGLAEPVALALGRVGLTPNGLTLIGFAIAIVAAAAAAAGAWLAAGLLVIFGGVFDLFDGTLARATGQASRLGAFMDSVFDRWGEGVIYVGIAAGAVGSDDRLAALLATAALGSSQMVPYVRAKSEGLGFTPGTGMASVGLAPREVRIVILAVGLVLVASVGSVAAHAALALITILSTITTIQRIVHVIRQQQTQEQG